MFRRAETYIHNGDDLGAWPLGRSYVVFAQRNVRSGGGLSQLAKSISGQHFGLIPTQILHKENMVALFSLFSLLLFFFLSSASMRLE